MSTCLCPRIACPLHGDDPRCHCFVCASEVAEDPALRRLHDVTRRMALARRPLPAPTEEPPPPHWSDR